MVDNEFNMINIMNKKVTKRVAIAKGQILFNYETYHLIKNRSLPKGNPLLMAEISGIMAAKNTSQLLPLCHPILLDFVKIKNELNDEKLCITIYAIVGAESKTGVEMEALSAVNSSLLTIYDLAKQICKNIVIKNIELLFKSGGKSGTWITNSNYPEWMLQYIKEPIENNLSGIDFAVITLSDRASKGIYDDNSGNYLKTRIQKNNGNLVHYALLPDEPKELQEIIQKITEEKPIIVLTNGGTGFSKRDKTPEALKAISTREFTGIGELLRKHGSNSTKFSWLSRSSAFEVKNSLVICLPGSEKAVSENMDALIPILPHIHSILIGNNHDKLS